MIETTLARPLGEALPTPGLGETIINGTEILLLNRIARKLVNPELKKHAELEQGIVIDLEQSRTDALLRIERTLDSENESVSIVRAHWRDGSDSPRFWVTAESTTYHQGEAKVELYDHQLDEVASGKSTLPRSLIKDEIRFALKYLQPDK